MRGILVSDIFGLTDEIIELRNLIAEDVVILDPYQGKKNLFTYENDAYNYFTEHCDLGEYAKLVHHAKNWTPMNLTDLFIMAIINGRLYRIEFMGVQLFTLWI